MPNLSITVGSVTTTGTIETGIAGATVTAGQALYLDTSVNKLKLADANGSAATRVVYGIALHAAVDGQPLSYQRTGSITIGATLVPGMTYVLSNTAGGICPITDLISGDYFVVIGYATSTTVLLLAINASATVATTQPGYLTQECVIDRVVDSTAVGTSTVDGDILDMGAAPGYEGVTFIASFGAITDGTPGLKASQGAQSNMSDGADLVGTSVTVAAASDDNKLVVLEIVKPLERYLRCHVTRGGSTGSVIDSVIALRYKATPANLPTSQSSDVVGIERHLSPAEGTA